MSPSTKRLCLSAAGAFAAVLLAACGGSNDTIAPPADASVRVVHASPDAPAVDIDLNGSPAVTNLDYGQATTAVAAKPGALNVTVRGRLPGTSRPAVIGPTEITLAAGGAYAVLAVNTVAAIEPLVVTRESSAVSSANVRLQVVHAAPAAPAVAVYVTAPGADLASSTPVGSVAFKESLAAATVPAGDYQIRVTPSGASTPVVYDSGTVSLAGGSDLLVVALQNTGPGASPISLLAVPATGSALRLLDKATPARVRVIHASPDAPAVQVIANDNFGAPLVPSLAFPNATPFLDVPGATYNLKVTPVGNNGVIAINADATLAAGAVYSIYAVGLLASIEPLILTDDPRRVATQARVRIVHASPSAGGVDLYVLAPGTALASATPAFTNAAFKADTGYVDLAAGDYEVSVTPTGSKTAAIGPVTVTVANNGIYTVAARDAAGGGVPLSAALYLRQYDVFVSALPDGQAERAVERRSQRIQVTGSQHGANTQRTDGIGARAHRQTGVAAEFLQHTCQRHVIGFDLL